MAGRLVVVGNPARDEPQQQDSEAHIPQSDQRARARETRRLTDWGRVTIGNRWARTALPLPAMPNQICNDGASGKLSRILVFLETRSRACLSK
jgi:hypothetical protein